jgi:hypothetical protein
VPYSANAFRNRLDNPEPHKNMGATAIKFDMGVVNKSIHPYRTVKNATELPASKPFEVRRGFTNAAITAEMTRRWHKSVWAQ